MFAGLLSLFNWLLLIIIIALVNSYLTNPSWQALFFGILLGIWLLHNISEAGLRECFLFGKEEKNTANKSSKTSESTPKQIRPYPMDWNCENSAIGAVDKCCEFAAYCIGSVIPMDICKPEPFTCSISVNKQSKEISYSILWTTNYYSLDSTIKEKGLYLGNGFGFSDYNGVVTYLGSIANDDKAFLYLTQTPVAALKNEFVQIVKNNFTGLSTPHSTCTVVERSDFRDFTITIYF